MVLYQAKRKESLIEGYYNREETGIYEQEDYTSAVCLKQLFVEGEILETGVYILSNGPCNR